MTKKIYDIKPPELIKKAGQTAEAVVKKSGLKSKNKKHAKRKPRKENNSNFLFVKILTAAGIFSAILIVYLFFNLPRAKVDIWPKTDILNFKEKITADILAAYVDLDNKVIPANYLEEQMEFSQEFPATGNSLNEGKAGGIFTIYNKCDFFQPVALKIGTHFISDSGKYFKILSKAVVPAAKKQGGKIIPGSLSMEVEASEGGEEYNIKPASFSVPKFAGNALYYCIYAESKEPMAGGFSSEFKKVTEENINNARNAVESQLLSNIENSLKSKVSSDYILMDNAVSLKIISGESNIKIGTVIDKFNYGAKAKAGALMFKKEDLDKFAKDYIVSKIEDSMSLVEESLDIKYNQETVDFDWGKTGINMEFSAKTYQYIDKNSLAFLLRRKTGEQINETINNNLGDRVLKVKVNFWPFWVAKSPKNQKAIKIELIFE